MNNNLLTISNSWEYYKYYILNKEIDPNQIKKVKINDQEYKVIHKECGSSYSDMGHSYNVTRTELYINVQGFEVNLSKNMLYNKNFNYEVEII